jgi:hypothetical protein
MAPGERPEFKPEYCNKKKKKETVEELHNGVLFVKSCHLQ